MLQQLVLPNVKVNYGDKYFKNKKSKLFVVSYYIIFTKIFNVITYFLQLSIF